MTSSWRVLPAYLVRLAGFSLERLAALRFRESAGLAASLDEAERRRGEAGRSVELALGQERYEGNPVFDDPTDRKRLRARLREVRRFALQPQRELPDEALAEAARAFPIAARPIAELRAAHLHREAAVTAYVTAFARELEERRDALRRLYCDERLREAVFLESPAAHDRIEQLMAMTGSRTLRARQRERLAIMYAQRFAAKNDTNSMCGPIGIGWTDRPVSRPGAPIEIVRDAARRQVYFSHWAAERLLVEAARAAGAAALVPLRINPTVTVRGAVATWCAMDHDATTSFQRRYRRAELPGPVLEVIRLLEVLPRSRAELAAEVGLSDAELEAVIEDLTAAELLFAGAAVPAGLFRPLDAALQQMAGWPASAARDHARGRARALDAILDEFTAAALPRRRELYEQLAAEFRELTGAADHRGGGRHYADRSLVHEDGFVEVECDLGPDALTALTTALPTLVAVAELPLELARETVREWFRSAFGDGARAAALEVHRAFDRDRVLERRATTASAEALRAAMDRVRAIIGRAASASNGEVAHIEAAQLEEALEGVPAGRRAGYVNADIMLRARPDRPPQLVIGEMHGFLGMPTCLLDVLPPAERDATVAAMRAALAELAAGRRTAECRFLHTQATDRRFPLADVDLEVISASERAGAVRFGELEMELEGDRFRFLVGAEEIVPVVAYGTYPFLLYTGPLAALVDDFSGRFFPDELLPDELRGVDGPRLVVGDIVFRRRTWVRPAEQLRAALAADRESELFQCGQRLRRQLGCGSHLFAALPGEPKPVLVEFDDFFLIEALVHLLARLPPGSAVKLTEMLPGPDELTARGPDGRRTSELRMAFYRVA